MSYLKFRESCLSGIKRDIKSRREGKKISPEKFNTLVDRYFNTLPLNENFRFTYNQNDLDDLLFILRYKSSSCDFKLTALGSSFLSRRGMKSLPVDRESL